MGDYAAAPIQPIVQGLLTVSTTPNHVPTFQGRGVSAVTRVAGPPIAYVLTLDAGLPGNAGELAPTGAIYPAAAQPSGAGAGASSVGAASRIPTPDARSSITIRGSLTNGVVGASGIINTAITYITPGADGGFTQVQLIFQSLTAGALPLVSADPTDAFAAGAEFVLWVDAARIN